MAILTIEQLKELFAPGDRPGSSDFIDLIDTLSDDRTAVHVGMSEPTDGSGTPLWFDDLNQILYVYDGTEWVAAGSGGGGGADGDSAYEIAVDNGFSGTEQQWLDSLVGETGLTGEAGPQGETGLTGPEGPQGPAGEEGPQGDTGLTGPEGPQGPQGIQGETGPQGIQGEQGIQGIQGEVGLTGDTGPQGIQGIQGETGLTGPGGPAGPQGETGLTGPEGPTGDLDILANVNITDVSEGDVLLYDADNSEWINGTIEEPNYASDQAVLAGQIFG
jgi:hypothetical protein